MSTYQTLETTKINIDGKTVIEGLQGTYRLYLSYETEEAAKTLAKFSGKTVEVVIQSVIRIEPKKDKPKTTEA